jgi:hypothetical protein
MCPVGEDRGVQLAACGDGVTESGDRVTAQAAGEVLPNQVEFIGCERGGEGVGEHVVGRIFDEVGHDFTCAARAWHTSLA